MSKIEQKIPEGWSVKTLGELGDIVSGGTPDTENSTFWDGDVYWLTPSEVTKLPTKYVYQTERTITKEGLKNSSAKLLPKNSLIICTRATVGDCCINAVPISTNQGFKNIILYEGDNIIYLYYLIVNNKFQFIRKACGSTFLEISKKDVSNLKFLLPPLPEQGKIAGILSCWDDGIEKLSALIEKKKTQKKALMQQLLTGKHRFKGFSTPWHEVKLKDVLYEHKETSKGDETICSVSVHKGIISQIEHLGRSFAASNTSNYNLVHYGDVVYTKSPTGEFPYGIFKQSQQRTSVIVSPLYGVFTPKTYYLGYILDVFFSYAINLNNYLKPIIQKGAKNTINITNETFLSKAIFLPEETTEIQKLAEIFIKADEEIELLNKKLEAFKQEKKALMQQLLTGKIRVKVN